MVASAGCEIVIWTWLRARGYRGEQYDDRDDEELHGAPLCCRGGGCGEYSARDMIGYPPCRRRQAPRRPVILGTATPGGGFPVYGAAVADTIHETDPGITIEQRNTKGSTENVPMLEARRLDIALVQGEVAHEAFNGIGRPPADLRIVAAMYSTPGMFVVRADSPYRRIEDLRGKPVIFGARGSGLVILAEVRARWARPRTRTRFSGDLPRSGRRRAGHGARRSRRGAVGRRPGLAGLRRRRQGAGRRQVHRARRERDRAHPRQARVPQAA